MSVATSAARGLRSTSSLTLTGSPVLTNPRLRRGVPGLQQPRLPGAVLVLMGLLASLLGPTGAFADEARSTRIVEPLVIGEERCTIEIVADTVACFGSNVLFTAVLDCADGLMMANEPQWFLDGAPVGTGTEIELQPGPGAHLVEVSCGSCQDQASIEISVCSQHIHLDAAFSNDATEESTGIFLAPHIGPVNGFTFAYMRHGMRPFTLSADSSVASGSYALTLEGDAILNLYTPSGTPIPLPAHFDRSDLPVSFLVDATDFGTAELVAAYSSAVAGEDEDPNQDRVKIRVGPWPGLSGKVLDDHPHFHFVDTFNHDAVLTAALDPFRHAERVGLPYDAYVVPHRTPVAWGLNNALTDVSGGAEAMVVSAGSISGNVALLWNGGLDAGALSRSYDIVFDFGRDGFLDPGDLIDGFSLSEAGCHIVADLSLAGPHPVTTVNYSGGSFLVQRLYYPTDIALMANVPVVVLSHGNGHHYTWYDYLGSHLASHGYVMMAHENNTQPGIETASTTTLTNTDYLLGHLSTIAGGALLGHLDDSDITWFGHSRGGEGVVRAYDRVRENPNLVQNFAYQDIGLIGSIAPTVFLSASESDPHDVDYFLIGAGADGDVSGRPNCSQCQYFRLNDRSAGTVQTLYVHGAAHNDFNCCGSNDGTGPNQIGRAQGQLIAKSYFLALLEYDIKGNPATKEYLTRLYDDLGPSGISPNVEISLSYRELATPQNRVIDDFQTATSSTLSSSGGAVTYDVSNLFEGFNEDTDDTFSPLVSDPMNGMTYHSDGGDFTRGAIFDYTVGQTRYLEFEVISNYRDLRDFRFLSFRAAQGTRHAETRALNGSHSFAVTLRDASGATNTVRFGAWGALSPLYPRTGSGDFAGWVNEMNTVRIPLAAFETDGAGLDLSNIEAVRFEFGAAFGSPRGRIGIDDIQIMKE